MARDLDQQEEVTDEEQGEESSDILSELLAPTEIAWEAHNPLSGEGRRRHYIVLALFMLVGGLVSFWQSSWSTLLVIASGIGMWEMRERFQKPVRVHANSQGLAINGNRYPHAQLASFDIHRMPDSTHELSIYFSSWHAPSVRLPLGTTDPIQVRAVLQQYIPEESHTIPLIEWYLRRGA